MRIGRHEVGITNPDKVFFPEPGLTKGDLVGYYLGVAPFALHHIRRRLFHMKRYPNGVAGEFFHQKRVPENHPPYVDEQYVEFPSGHSTVFAVVDNAAALAGSPTSGASSCTRGTRASRRSSGRTTCSSTSTRPSTGSGGTFGRSRSS